MLCSVKARNHKEMKLINPSTRLRAAVNVVDSGYTHTCRSSTCCHASHDPGYNWIEAEIPEGVEVHTYAGNPSEHQSTCLHEEYVESHTAEGIPLNAPEWSKTLDTRRYNHPCHYGEWVKVDKDEEFTVVKLMTASNNRHYQGYVEGKLFATKDGVRDDTKEYRKVRFDRKLKAETSRFVAAGLTPEEAFRLFKIGREQWTGEQEGLLIELAATLRISKQGLIKLGWANSRRVQQEIIARHSLGIPSMSHPRTQAFAAKALWVFHKAKPTAEDYSKVSDEQSSPIRNSSAEDVPSLRPGLVSLETLFAAV